MHTRSVALPAVLAVILWTMTGALLVGSWATWTFMFDGRRLWVMLGLSAAVCAVAAAVCQVRCNQARMCVLIRSLRNHTDADVLDIRTAR